MNILSSTFRHRLLGNTLAAAACIVVVACSGATTPQTVGTGNGTGNGNGTGDGNGNGSGNGNGETDGGVSVTDPPVTEPDGSTVVVTADGATIPVKPPGTDSSVPPVSQVDGSACSATGSEVVMIGDSYPALSGEIPKQLQILATAAGALASGDAYRGYYKSGANMATYPSSTITAIPAQFAQAVAKSADIKYVIMDGGGNDILLENPQCIDAPDAASPISQACQTSIQNAITAATTLFETMKTDGVQKVVYYFYPHLPTSGRPSVNTIMDYAYPLVAQACSTAAVPCSFVDTRAAFDGHPEYIGPDGIHPTTAGSDVIAGLIWETMQQQCIAL